MKKIIITAFIGILFTTGTRVMAQQIPMFSSYTLNKFLINPSFAGSNGQTNIYGINRIQYAGFDGAPITYMLTADAGFKDKKFGLGGMLFSDRNSLIAQNGFQLAYAYTVKLSESWKLGFGLNAGMSQWNINFDQLRVDEQNEDVISTYQSSATTFRSDFGFNISSDKFEIGVSLPQLVASKVKYSDYLKNSEGEYASVLHYVANLAYTLNLKNDVKFKPMVVVRGAADINPQIDVMGMLDWKKKAYLTVGYRTNYAATIGGGLHLGKGITFGYAYDRPLNDISKYSTGSHEFVVGVTIGDRGNDKSEPAKGLTKDSEDKLKSDLEKQIKENISKDLESKLSKDLDEKINKAVELSISKALENTTVSPGTTGTKTSPSTGATVSKADLDKIKKDIEASLNKQMEDSYAKLVDAKIKKAIESQPAPKEVVAQPNKAEVEKQRKESEEKIRKNIEESLKKELSAKIDQSIKDAIDKEAKKAKEEELKKPKEYKMTAKDKAMIDSLKMRNTEYENRIVALEFQLKSFPESDRVENADRSFLSRSAHLNDIELKSFKAEQRQVYDNARDDRSKKTAENQNEPDKFIIVLAAFKSIKEAQQYQKLASQTFEYPNSRILKPGNPDGYYFVYQKSFQRKKDAWEEFDKVFNTKTNTPTFSWIYVFE